MNSFPFHLSKYKKLFLNEKLEIVKGLLEVKSSTEVHLSAALEKHIH